MQNNHYINRVRELNTTITDRKEFHARAGKLLMEMGNDPEFWSEVFKSNLTNKGYLKRAWTMYEIPFFYVYENDDFYIKVHLFVPLKDYAPHIAASAIHHHNNYLLTSYAAFGPGYESLLFEKDHSIDLRTKEVNLKIRKRFNQGEEPLSQVDSWEPHVVINPVSLSATLVLWSPDKKRATDSLRSNPILKALKTPLRKLIYLMGMDKKVGIAAKDTYQFYVKDDKFHAIPEDDFFAPTRAQSGADVDDYSIQTVFAFMQRMKFNDYEFLKKLKEAPDTPLYYHKWIDMMLNDTPIPDTYAKETINIPGGKMQIDDIINAEKSLNKRS